MLYIDEYYLKSISYLFESFTDKGNHVFNVRCPICGDSHKKKSKARGYFYKSRYGSKLNYMCHNCGASMSFGNFLKEYAPETYQDYALEVFGKNKVRKKDKDISKKQFQRTNDLNKRFSLPENAQRISHLNDEHLAKKYLHQRKIPEEHFADIFYTDDFQKFMKQYEDMGKSFPEAKNFTHTPKILFPFYDKSYNLLGFQARILPNEFNEIRFLTVKLYENIPKLYGLHRLNKNVGYVYVVEGPIDSLFLSNTIAMMGSDIPHETVVHETGTNNITYILDNEPRSKETKQKMKKLINKGYSVVVWPDYIKEKDINDMILAGYTQEQIISIIQERTAFGIKAELLFSEWRK